jgi:putative ABC transport system permease protein
MAVVAVDQDFFNTLKSEFVLGNNFPVTNTTSNNLQVIINESAMHVFNLTNPIGVKLDGLGKNSYMITGVIKNIHFSSIREKIEPMVFYIQPWANSIIIVRTKQNNIQTTIQVLKNYWERLAPNHVFQYSFMNKNIDNIYIQEHKAAFLFSLFTILTIFLSLFGLIGLISFTIESSIKEIVLRKIFGANIFNVNLIFYKKMIGVVLIAILISCPLAYVMIKSWLQEFTYKVNITFTPFLLTSITILILILLCISFHILKGNKLNITKALKQY